MDKLKEGMFSNNPVLVQLIGFCSVLAVSSTVLGAVGMSLSFMFVLILSNIVISLLRNFIPNEIRIPAFIVVIASFVTILQMCLQAYFEEIYNLLGIFLPLIVVNCIILGRAEAFASKNGVVASAIDGLVNGLGYGFVIITVAIVRELIGAGTLLGVRILPEAATIPFLLQPASSFILLGIFLAVMNQIKLMQAKKAKEKDIPRILELLEQVLQIHADIRPDIFIPDTTKYTTDELTELLKNKEKPVYVAVNEDDVCVGYAFCQLQEQPFSNNMVPFKTFFIDDLCVSQEVRGQHVGESLFEYVKNEAKQIGCYEVTLNVWAGNTSAEKFYEKMGMRTKERQMEYIL